MLVLEAVLLLFVAAAVVVLVVVVDVVVVAVVEEYGDEFDFVDLKQKKFIRKIILMKKFLREMLVGSTGQGFILNKFKSNDYLTRKQGFI